MYVRVNANDTDVTKQVEKVMQFYLTSVTSDLESIAVSIDDVSDRLGANLKRCTVCGLLVAGDAVEVVETQADLMLAVTRAMDRCVRTVRRRRSLQRFSRSA
jgi:hypothetical protein